MTPEKRIENEILERIDRNTIPEPNTGCLLWTGASHRFGYGQMRIKKKTHNVYRIVYELINGPLGKGQVIRHKCDTPQCCSPNHLEVGTQTDNMQDMSRRGRCVNQNTNKTHCKNGHEFTLENTLYSAGSRICRTCNTEYQRLRREAGLKPYTKKDQDRCAKYRKDNKEKVQAYMRAYYLKKKGVTKNANS